MRLLSRFSHQIATAHFSLISVKTLANLNMHRLIFLSMWCRAIPLCQAAATILVSSPHTLQTASLEPLEKRGSQVPTLTLGPVSSYARKEVRYKMDSIVRLTRKLLTLLAPSHDRSRLTTDRCSWDIAMG